MKTTRKILPALVMLLVSAIMLSTASYAWFASNSTVTATGMSVKVKANNYYLEIAKPATTPAFGSGVELTNETKEIELVHAMFGTPKNPATAPDQLNWYLGTSNSATSVGDISNDATALNFGDTTIRDKYVLYNEVLVRMSPSSDIALSNLTLALTSANGAPITKVTPKDSSKNDPMKATLRILAVAYDPDDDTTVLGAQIYDAGTGTLVTGADNYLLTSVALGKQYRIAIYLYFDGQDEVAMTSQAGNLDAYVVDVAFNATTPTPGT